MTKILELVFLFIPVIIWGGECVASLPEQRLMKNQGCVLTPTIDAESCTPYHDSNVQTDPWATDDKSRALVQRISNSYLRKQKKLLQANWEIKAVPDGTQCSLLPKYGSDIFYECQNGVWTEHLIEHRFSGWTREKRSDHKLISYKTCRKSCSGTWFWKSCSYRCVTNYKKDYHPTITCPIIQDTYTNKGRSEKVMQWSPATAEDKEDGTLRHLGHSVLKNGTYRIAYQAKDKQGSTATCEVVFTVRVRTCPHPGQRTTYTFSWLTYFPHGNIFCSHGNIYGSVCTFACDQGYKLSGASQLECQENGLWAPAKPNCTLQSCIPPSPVLHGQWSACSRHVIGSVCTLTCDEGYNVIGSPKTTCQRDGTWSNQGKCRDSKPPEIRCPADISVYSLPRKQPVQVHWSMPTVRDNSRDHVNVTSNHVSGDLFPVGNTTVVFQARDTSANMATCSMNIQVKVKYCEPLSAPAEGQIDCTLGHAVGSECSLSCGKGHQLKGVSSRTCLDTKVWSNSHPSCEKMSCGPPPLVAHGKFNCNESHLYEDTCSLRCHPGYVATSPLIIVCEATSQWSEAGSCIDGQAPKFPKGCPDVSRFASTFGQPTYVIYQTPEVTDNSGDSVTVTADITSGSEFQVGTTDVTFTAVDMSGNTATCILTVTVVAIECLNPLNTDLDNSKEKVMRFSCPDGHVFGASCSVSCSDGSRQAGPTTITCQQNGTSIGYWWYGNVQPFCNAKTCSAPEQPTYGSTACDVLADKGFCVVLCREGYTFPKVQLENGGFLCLLSTGEWVPRAITSRMCYPGIPASGVEIMPDIYYYSNSCSSDSEEIKRKFIGILNSTTIFEGVCGTKNVSCKVDTVTVTCGSRGKRSVDGFVANRNPRNKRAMDLKSGALIAKPLQLRSKRDVDSASHKTEIEFKIKISYKEPDNGTKVAEFYNHLVYDLNERLNQATVDGEFDIPEAGETNHFSYGYGIEEFECSAGTGFQAHTDLCAGCGPGYVSVSQSESCSVCPVGTYQPEDEGTECMSCPHGFSTKTIGSKSSNDCKALCLPGTYSKTGLEPCDTCRRGSYQAGTGKNSCDFCPYGMSTVSDGATSMDDCKSFLIKLTNVSNSLDYSVKDGQLSNFTAMTWVKSPNDLIDTETTFTLTEKPGDASFGCGDFTVYISVSKKVSKREKRQWNHILMSQHGNLVELYVNGGIRESKQPSVTCTDLNMEFTGSESLEELILSGVQISNLGLTQEEVASMSFSCGLILEGNILITSEKHIDSLRTLSSCDDTDNCKDGPCGLKGVCIDLVTSYRCECDELWSGVNCEVEPDFCKGNQCENNAQCVNQVQDGNYTCVCKEDYRGRLCSEKIVNGGWSSFTKWTECSATCDAGTRSRSRTCDNPIPGPDGKMCEGPDEETENCFLKHCPVDGGFSQWTTWVCPVTCGEGTSTRTRECDNPAPAHGGNDCVGSLVEAKDCENLEPCPINGGYGNFSEWSPCSKSCGGGVSTRERTCDSPIPQFGGIPCDPDQATENRHCNVEKCPVCRNLIRSKHAETLNCSYDDTKDMKECQIVCKKGYLVEQDKSFICGRATNFTWSHATPENPRGRLLECQVANSPRSLTMKITVVYPAKDLTPEVAVDSVEDRLKETIDCAKCKLNVETTKDKDDSFKLQVVMQVQMPNPDLDLRKATDYEIEQLRNSFVDFEAAAQRLANNSNYIFDVSHNNKNIMPDASSITEVVEIGCPIGTEAIDETCGTENNLLPMKKS